ncbi:MAG: hypothetical protein CMJ38_07675 [Phycisphaerae bacterium]|nr:hypothetical protein [Phycisphaerae bacterium]
MIQTPFHNRRGFSLTEIVVVIAIIGVLVGILVPSIFSIKMKAKKTKELNVLKQVMTAWATYSSDHQNKLLPGYLDVSYQEHYELAWAFPDETLIPPAPSYDSDYLNIVGPWPWRLLPYLDENWRSLLFYKELDWEPFAERVNAHANEITQTPAFGYNGMYLGGWKLFNEAEGRTQTLFGNAKLADDTRMNVVTSSLAQVNSPTTTIAFASTFLGEDHSYGELPDDIDGANMAIPSVLADSKRWTILPDGKINSYAETYVPVGRYNGMPAIGFADGHVENVVIHTLLNQKMWIPKAREVNGVPVEKFTHSP